MFLRRYLWLLAGLIAGCGALVGLFGVKLVVSTPPGVDQVAWTLRKGEGVVDQGMAPVQKGAASWTLLAYNEDLTLEVLGQAGDFPLYRKEVTLTPDLAGRELPIRLDSEDRGQLQLLLEPSEERAAMVYVYVPDNLGDPSRPGPPLSGYTLVGSTALPEGTLLLLPLAPEYKVGVDLGSGGELCFPTDPLRLTPQEALASLQKGQPVERLVFLDFSRCQQR